MREKEGIKVEGVGEEKRRNKYTNRNIIAFTFLLENTLFIFIGFYLCIFYPLSPPSYNIFKIYTVKLKNYRFIILYIS